MIPAFPKAAALKLDLDSDPASVSDSVAFTPLYASLSQPGKWG